MSTTLNSLNATEIGGRGRSQLKSGQTHLRTTFCNQSRENLRQIPQGLLYHKDQNPICQRRPVSNENWAVEALGHRSISTSAILLDPPITFGLTRRDAQVGSSETGGKCDDQRAGSARSCISSHGQANEGSWNVWTFVVSPQTRSGGSRCRRPWFRCGLCGY